MIEELRETIKKYLKGQLSEAEKAAFEYRIANEPEVEKAVNIIRLERLSIDLMFENDLRQKMREWKAENEAKSASKSIKRHKVLKRFWLPICLFLSVLGVGVYFFVKKYIPKSTGNTLPVSHPMQKVDSLKFDSSSFKIKPPLASSNGKEIKSKEDTQTRRNLKPNNDIASTNLAMQDIVWVYYDRPKFSSVDSRGSGSEKIESNISLAEKAFDAGDFETVLNLLDKISNQEKTDIQWLKGHTLFNLRRFSDAEKSFRESSELGKEERQKRAEWNRTLCILAMGKRQEAQSLLTIIAMETGGLFEEKAKEILLKIK